MRTTARSLGSAHLGFASLLLLAALVGCGEDAASSAPRTGNAAATGGRGAVDGGQSGASANGGQANGGAATSNGGQPNGGQPSGGGQPGAGTNSGGQSASGGAGGAKPTDPQGVPPTVNVAPSIKPPGGLLPQDVPLFVVLGIDDNMYEDGMKWTLDQLEGRANPGSSQSGTHDGESVKATFFHIGSALEAGGEGLLTQWKRAVAAGHEVGNHSNTHRLNENNVAFDWVSELQACNQTLVEKLGVKREVVLGVRAPYLDFLQPALLPAMDKVGGFQYDTSIRHDPVTMGLADWKFYADVWPYTLDNGIYTMAAGGYDIGKHPGMWEIPPYTLPKLAGREALFQPSNLYTAFDSTAYGTLGLTGKQFEDGMKWALDLKLQDGDSRAPLTIGLHSDTYSEQNTGYKTPLAERRQALVNFLNYAQTKPEVRFVTYQQLIHWMVKPVPLAK